MKARPPDKIPLPGLHVLKDHWRQRSYLEYDCRTLMGDGQLKSAIAVTFEAAPQRTQGYVPPRLKRAYKIPEDMSEASKERRLEAGLFAKFGQASSPSVSGLWDRLVYFQVPLFNSLHKEGWGCIDLLGLTAHGEPVVIELKIGESADTPLHALLEASTYTTALRRHWKQVAQELREFSSAQNLSLTVSDEPQVWPIVLLAPPAYWQTCGKGATGNRDCVQAFRELCDRFGGEDDQPMPIHHAEVGGVASDWDGMTVPEPERLSVASLEVGWDARQPPDASNRNPKGSGGRFSLTTNVCL